MHLERSEIEKGLEKTLTFDEALNICERFKLPHQLNVFWDVAIALTQAYEIGRKEGIKIAVKDIKKIVDVWAAIL